MARTNMRLARKMRSRYHDDEKAGHKDAAEYWRGQAAAYFTGNPYLKTFWLKIEEPDGEKGEFYSKWIQAKNCDEAISLAEKMLWSPVISCEQVSGYGETKNPVVSESQRRLCQAAAYFTGNPENINNRSLVKRFVDNRFHKRSSFRSSWVFKSSAVGKKAAYWPDGYHTRVGTIVALDTTVNANDTAVMDNGDRISPAYLSGSMQWKNPVGGEPANEMQKYHNAYQMVIFRMRQGKSKNQAIDDVIAEAPFLNKRKLSDYVAIMLLEPKKHNPVVSESQRRLFGIAYGIKTGRIPRSYSPEAARIADSMSKKDIRDYTMLSSNPIKNGKYYVQISSAGGPVFQEVKGKSISVPGLESADLFLHRPLMGGGWKISSGINGMYVAWGSTKSEAIEYLRQKGRPEAIMKYLKRYIDKGGKTSPRFSSNPKKSGVRVTYRKKYDGPHLYYLITVKENGHTRATFPAKTHDEAIEAVEQAKKDWGLNPRQAYPAIRWDKVNQAVEAKKTANRVAITDSHPAVGKFIGIWNSLTKPEMLEVERQVPNQEWGLPMGIPRTNPGRYEIKWCDCDKPDPRHVSRGSGVKCPYWECRKCGGLLQIGNPVVVPELFDSVARAWKSGISARSGTMITDGTFVWVGTTPIAATRNGKKVVIAPEYLYNVPQVRAVLKVANVKMNPRKPTIYDIKYAVQEKQPFFFSHDTMKFFGQTLRDFVVVKSASGRIFVVGFGKHGVVTVREFTGDDLKHVEHPNKDVISYLERL